MRSVTRPLTSVSRGPRAAPPEAFSRTEKIKNKEVGNALAISERTVKTHLTNIFQKLGVRDRVGLVMHALRHGLTRAA